MKFRILIIIIGIVAGFSCVKAQQETNYTLLMRNAVNNNNLNHAMQLYTAAKEDDYYDMESLERITCEIFYRQKQYEQALATSQKLRNEDENNNMTDFILMACLSQKGSANDSLIASIADDLGSNPIERTVLQQLEIINRKDIDNIAAAISRFLVKERIEKTSELKSYKTILTILFFINGHYTDAYTSSIDYLTMDNQAVIYYILGILREKRQEYSSAVSFLTMAIKNGYNHYDAYLQRAVCYGYEKDYLRSNIDLDTCMMIDSNYYVFYLKGINYNHLHQYQDALLHLDYSITLNDTFADSYNYRGIVSSNMHEYAFAILDFRRTIQLDKRTPFVHNNLGIALEMTGKTEEAIKEYELSISYEPNLPDAWYNLGRIYTDRHETRKAIKYLTRASLLDSDIPDTYYLLGINYQYKQDKQKACQMYTSALELGHTLAQDKIDNYCNRPDEVKEKKNTRIREYEDDLYEDDSEEYTNE